MRYLIPLAATAFALAAPATAQAPPDDTPSFLASCALSHSAPDDPIVHRGMPGMSHMHDFYGNVSTDARSTAARLARAQTNCHPNGDRSAYWTPALYVRGRKVRPTDVTIYYDAPPAHAGDVRPLPTGLKIVAGDQFAKGLRPGSPYAWGCRGTSTAVQDRIPVCPKWSRVTLSLRFPDCWDGRHLDSRDHKRHMAYSSGGACPARAPVLVPRVRFEIGYATSGAPDAVLASGRAYTTHGDFLDAWAPRVMRSRVERCLHGGIRCNYAGQPY